MKAKGMQILKSPARPGPTFWFLTWLFVALLLVSCGDTPAGAPTAAPTQAITAAPHTGSAPSQTSPVTTASPGITTIGDRTAPPPLFTNAPGTPGQAALTTTPATITKSSGEKLYLTIELARTDQEHETGLMGRQSVPDDTGMLFIFKQSGRMAFWMKDTPLPLSIAFIAQDGKIVDIQDMESYSLDNHAPNQDYIYALEVSKGYFARKGVKPGDTFTFKS